MKIIKTTLVPIYTYALVQRRINGTAKRLTLFKTPTHLWRNHMKECIDGADFNEFVEVIADHRLADIALNVRHYEQALLRQMQDLAVQDCLEAQRNGFSIPHDNPDYPIKGTPYEIPHD